MDMHLLDGLGLKPGQKKIFAELCKRVGYRFPIPAAVALKARGLGPKTLAALIDGGLIQAETHPFAKLSVRLRNALENWGINTVAEAREAIETKKLYPGRNRWFGLVSYRELVKFLGVKEDLPVKHACPTCGARTQKNRTASKRDAVPYPPNFQAFWARA